MKGQPLGNIPVLVSLMDILNEDHPHLRRKVTHHVHKFRRQIKSLRAVENPRHREEFLRLLREDHLREIRSKGWPKAVETHLVGGIITIYRNELRSFSPSSQEWNRKRREDSRKLSPPPTPRVS